MKNGKVLPGDAFTIANRLWDRAFFPHVFTKEGCVRACCVGDLHRTPRLLLDEALRGRGPWVEVEAYFGGGETPEFVQIPELPPGCPKQIKQNIARVGLTCRGVRGPPRGGPALERASAKITNSKQ